MPDAIQVTTTLPSRDGAAEMARALVDERLAACVQVVGPISSTYRWRGEVEVADEWLLLIKATAERFPELERAIRARHPYDVPEILATPVTAGAAAYLDWIASEASDA